MNQPTNISGSGKAELELTKLRNEVREQERFVLFRPAYIAALSPLILGIIAVSVTWATGLLDDKKRELLLDKRDLQYQYDQLANRKSALTDSITILQDTLRYYERLSFKANSIADSLHGLLTSKEGLYHRSLDSLAARRRELQMQFNKRVDSLSLIRLRQSDSVYIKALEKENAMLGIASGYKDVGGVGRFEKENLRGVSMDLAYKDMAIDFLKRELEACRLKCPE